VIKLESLHLDLSNSSYEFSKTAWNLSKNKNRAREGQWLIEGPTGQRDPLDSDTETGESSSPVKLDDGEVSAESKGTVVTLSPRWSYRGTIPSLYQALGGSSAWMVKALVWFWIIDETLVLTSILSVCRLNEVGTCQVMEQVMIMVMMVMTTTWSSAQLEKKKEKNKTLWSSRQKYFLGFWFWWSRHHRVCDHI